MADIQQDGSSSSTAPNGAAVASSTDSMSLHARPTVADLHGENHFAQVARKNWLSPSSKSPNVRPEVVKKELWDELEKVDFAYTSLLVLENLQLLERYLWPGFTEDASNYHHLLLALMVNVKRRENLPAWDLFSSRPAEFSLFFRRILSMTVDVSQPTKIRTQLLSFVISAFQSLDSGIVRKECAPLVSISIWHNLHSEAVRDSLFEKNPMLRKAWRAASKRFDAGDEELQARLRFERSWLYTLILDFIDRIHDTTTREAIRDNLAYSERFVELLTDLQSQLPTRRYVNSLIRDLNLLSAIRTSTTYADEDNGLFRDLYNLLSHFTYFPIEDQTGRQLTKLEYDQEHYDALSKLQRVGYAAFEQRLQLLALANYGSIGKREELEGHLEALNDELVQLCSLMGLRTEYPSSTLLVRDRAFYMDALTSVFEQRPTFKDVVRDMPILPTERILYEATFLRNESYNGSRPLAIPKLNLQYLTMGDFLWRSFILYRCESFYGIRKDMEDVLKRVQPRGSGVNTKFGGFSRMSIPISKPAIIDIAPALVGEDHPARVRAEVILDVSRLQPHVRREWESLRPDDVVFLLAVEGQDDTPMRNGHHDDANSNAGEQLGLKSLRSAEVVQVLDENSRPLREQTRKDGIPPRARQRRLILNLDAKQFKEDMDRVEQGRVNIYERINLIVRRRGRENNFRPILESIRRLTLSDIPAPSWLQEVFLGYGDPSSATYKRLPNRLHSIDFRDTFLDWQHLIESLPGKSIEPHEAEQPSFGPPYVLEFAATEPEVVPARPSKKRRRNQVEVAQPVQETVHVSTYKPPNTGPYPADAPKLNGVRFTPAQVEAIASGTQPGLTVVVGPPGTGKTDVATQIISNIYHNFPDQRTLLIAHSNQALNQLFQKIVALDIDERHLLRLGHGEEDLETEASYSKHGRVESFLERGAVYLAEVDRLARTLNAPGSHAQSCETADYFNLVYVKPRWAGYWENVQSSEATVQQIVADFPFKEYFSNAPQPLFPPTASKEEIVDIVRGCYRHVEKIFAELEDIRPFEILRNPRDKANYLLVKEARIIAMTSTHAAMRRQEIASLGFHYDNVIMEEAAQITEIENFIPLALQNPQNGELPLQRIVLCGDHLQNSPIIQNLAFRQYANLEQSLFLRLVRLGVPTIMLDQQGRARPSIAELYRWRYPNLTNLPSVQTLPEFQTANPGFRHEYQFIDVPDYKGKGEMEPTPHFIQNLGEAEYAVALFMYMRLLGYPASKISILTTYAGQRALIKDVLDHRCKGNRLFGLPRIVATVDKYQGEQNDYIILSLVRTRTIGYLRDIRRLTVALSRARLGLYILGRRSVFESCFELKPAFDILLRKPDALTLCTGEMYGETARGVDHDVGAEQEAVMQGVEHLGKYVWEMTKAKVEALKAAGADAALQVQGQEQDGGGAMAVDEEDGDREDKVLVAEEDADAVGEETEEGLA